MHVLFFSLWNVLQVPHSSFLVEPARLGIVRPWGNPLFLVVPRKMAQNDFLYARADGSMWNSFLFLLSASSLIGTLPISSRPVFFIPIGRLRVMSFLSKISVASCRIGAERGEAGPRPQFLVSVEKMMRFCIFMVLNLISWFDFNLERMDYGALWRADFRLTSQTWDGPNSQFIPLYALIAFVYSVLRINVYPWDMMEENKMANISTTWNEDLFVD